RLNAAIAPVHKKVVELHLIDRSEQLPWMRRLMKGGIGRIGRQAQVESSAEYKRVADIVVHIGSGNFSVCVVDILVSHVGDVQPRAYAGAVARQSCRALRSFQGPTVRDFHFQINRLARGLCVRGVLRRTLDLPRANALPNLRNAGLAILLGRYSALVVGVESRDLPLQ